MTYNIIFIIIPRNRARHAAETRIVHAQTFFCFFFFYIICYVHLKKSIRYDIIHLYICIRRVEYDWWFSKTSRTARTPLNRISHAHYNNIHIALVRDSVIIHIRRRRRQRYTTEQCVCVCVCRTLTRSADVGRRLHLDLGCRFLPSSATVLLDTEGGTGLARTTGIPDARAVLGLRSFNGAPSPPDSLRPVTMSLANAMAEAAGTQWVGCCSTAATAAPRLRTAAVVTPSAVAERFNISPTTLGAPADDRCPPPCSALGDGGMVNICGPKTHRKHSSRAHAANAIS